jgi:hypothetical protein
MFEKKKKKTFVIFPGTLEDTGFLFFHYGFLYKTFLQRQQEE